MDQRAVQQGDLVRLRGKDEDVLYLVASVIEDDVDGYLVKVYDEKGKKRPLGDGMFYRFAAIEVVASR